MIIKLPTVPPTIANSLIVTERMIRSASCTNRNAGLATMEHASAYYVETYTCAPIAETRLQP